MLATNVAETSLTVPGIRSVVDPGTARISRYSARLKVQRLPIEPISQASADQRKGRCGRTSDGVAIRLYAEEDFEERPRFTDPEILRTNLAAVILRMAALELGDIEDFPFLDPPDRRQVRDGVRAAAGAAGDRRRRAPHADRAAPRAAPGRPAAGPDDPRGRRARLRGRGDPDRRRAVDPGPARAPAGAARAGRPAARALRRRDLGLPRLPEPLALPARAAARAVGQPVPQALQGRVPALRARARVAGPRRRAAALGQGAGHLAQPAARRAGRRPPRAAVGPALAPRRQGRRRGASTSAPAAGGSRSSPARRWRASRRRG